MVKRGIDISSWQGEINFRQLMCADIDFIMIRATVGMKEDLYFRRNVSMCERYKIPYGLYHASYAHTLDEVYAEAVHFAKTIAVAKPTYPVVYDIEDFTEKDSGADFNASAFTAVFCHYMEAKGYYAMFYTNTAFLRKHKMEGLLKVWDYWNAHWDISEPVVSCGIHQYTNKEEFLGIEGYVDANRAYKDYPYIISKMKEVKK